MNIFRKKSVTPKLVPGTQLSFTPKEDGDPSRVEANKIIEAQRMRIVKMLLNGDIYGLPGSQGTKWSNFREWAKNQHPILSMCMAHELHPFSRMERFSVTIFYLCWAFFITTLFQAVLRALSTGSTLSHILQDSFPGEHENREICDQGCVETCCNEEGKEWCGPGSGTNSDEMTVESYDEACSVLTPWWALSFIIAALTVPYSTILKVAATCACAQALPECLKNCFECIGGFVLRIFGLLSVLWLAFGIALLRTLDDSGAFLAAYVTGVVESWLYWPMLAGASFLFNYKKNKAKFEEKHPGQISMAWPICVEDQNLDIRVGKDGKPVAYRSPLDSPTAGMTQQQPDSTAQLPISSAQQGQPSGSSTGLAKTQGQQKPPSGVIYANPHQTVSGLNLPPGWEARVEANGGMLQLPFGAYGNRPHTDSSSAYTTPVTVGHQQPTLGSNNGQHIVSSSRQVIDEGSISSVELL